MGLSSKTYLDRVLPCLCSGIPEGSSAEGVLCAWGSWGMYLVTEQKGLQSRTQSHLAYACPFPTYFMLMSWCLEFESAGRVMPRRQTLNSWGQAQSLARLSFQCGEDLMSAVETSL